MIDRLATICAFFAVKEAGKEFARIAGFLNLNAQRMQLLRIQDFDPCTQPPDRFSTLRKLAGSVNATDNSRRARINASSKVLHGRISTHATVSGTSLRK